MPLMLAMENHTIDPIIIIKANNRLVRQSNSVSSKWLSCSFCLNRIQFSSVQYVFIYIASAAIKILSWHFPRSQNSTSAASSSGKENLSLQGPLKGKQHTGENKLTSAEHQSWSQHCCEALSVQMSRSSAFERVWVPAGAADTQYASTPNARTPTGILHTIYTALLRLHKI